VGGRAEDIAADADNMDWSHPRRDREAATSGKAITSLVLGLVSFCLPVLLSIPAIILGILGLGDAGRGKSGKGLAISGLILGSVTLVLGPLALFGLVFPVVQQFREATASMESQSHLKRIGVAIHLYESAYKKIPGHAIYSKDGKPLLSWRVAILPYIGENNLYKQFKLDEPWDSPHNRKLLEQMPGVYANLLDSSAAKKGLTHYQVFVGEPGLGPHPIFIKGPQNQYVFGNIPDGTDNTILVVEAAESVPWTAPQDIPYGPNTPLPKLGLSSQYAPVVMANGYIRVLNKAKLKEQTLRLAITADDGQLFSWE
jgi:hypothetical protein